MLDGPADFTLTQLWNWSYEIEDYTKTVTFTRLDLRQLGAVFIYKCKASVPVKLRIGTELIEFEKKPLPDPEQDETDPGMYECLPIDPFDNPPVPKLYFEECGILTDPGMLTYTEVELIADQPCQLTFTPRLRIGDDRIRSWLLYYPFQLNLGPRKYRVSKGSLTFIL